MRSLLPRVHAAVLALSLASAGCIGSQQTPSPNSGGVEGRLNPVDVPDAQFAADLHRVLRDGKASPERLALLAGVVRRQLAHAATRFGGGHDARATESVLGALYLVRTGEGRGEMIDPAADKAIAGAVERVSARGDEGRAEALLQMRAAALDPASPARKVIDEHLAAIAEWKKSTRTGGPMRQLGADERTAVARALVDPSDQALEDAVRAVNAWVTRAIEYQIAFKKSGQRPEREEAVEATRALESGGATMAALFLRNGDARGALDALNQTGGRRVILPALYQRIDAAAQSDAGREWQALAAVFAVKVGEETQETQETETDIDPQLLAAGLWGTALETYRRDPASFEASLLLSRSLLRYGMPEAAPLVLAGALGNRATPTTVSAALELVLTAVGDSARLDDLDTARRTFNAAESVLELAGHPDLRGKIEPTAARARFVMAGIEVRAGNLAAARPLLELAVAEEPSASGFTTLAMVERQAGDGAAALNHVERALAAPDAKSAILDVADAHLLAFELLRDAGKEGRAKTSLDAALTAVLGARQQRGSAAAHARAERILGRVLEGYGDGKGATRAFDRALSAAAADRPTLGAAMLDAVGRALVRRDLGSARAALKRGIDGDVSDEDLVYGGLWVSLLEREIKAPSDGTVERALRAGGRTAWTGKLTAWASGKLSDADLSTAAHSASQRVEAAFYTAMARKVAGDPSADQRLRQVASAPVIDLLEVQLARDLTAPRVRADLPGGVQLP
jgi:tetratricopeptide (TPR) repeat protein